MVRYSPHRQAHNGAVNDIIWLHTVVHQKDEGSQNRRYCATVRTVSISNGQVIQLPGTRQSQWLEPPPIQSLPSTIQDIEFARHRLIWDGDPRQLVDIYERYIRVNEDLRSAVEQRVSGLDSRPVMMRASDPENSESIDLAKRLQDEWNRLDNRHDVVQHLVRGARVHSFAPVEIGWRSTNRGVELERLWEIDQKSLIVATLHNRHQLENAIPGTWFLRRSPSLGDAEPLIQDKWIVGSPGQSVSLIDRSLMATSIYSGIFGQRILGSWTVFVDRYGVPFLHVEIHDYEDEQGKATARQVIERAGNDHGVITSSNDKMVVKVIDGAQVSRSGTSDVHGRYLDAQRQRIDRVWVGGALTMGTGGAGSYNQGQIHQDAYYALLQTDARLVERALQRELVRAWMRLNEFDPGLAPQVTLRVRLDTPGTVAQLVSTLAQGNKSMDNRELTEVLGYTITDMPS